MLPRRTMLGALLGGALFPGIALAEGGAPSEALDIADLGAVDAPMSRRIASLASRTGLKRVGFTAIDLSRGHVALLNESEVFPLHGLAMVPLSIAMLNLDRAGNVDLEHRVRLTSADISPGRSPMAGRLTRAPVMFTGHQLLQHILLNADTTAADALMRMAGGPERIGSTIADLGISGLRIDRYQKDIEQAQYGLKGIAPGKVDEALRLHLGDPRDTTSARAMATLLLKLGGGRLLTRKDTDFVLGTLRHTKSGNDRLAGGLKPGWTMAHRSGQSWRPPAYTAMYADAGIAYHGGRPRIAMVLFIADTRAKPDLLSGFCRSVSRTLIGSWA